MTKAQKRIWIEAAENEVLREVQCEANMAAKALDAQDLYRKASEGLAVAAERVSESRARLAALRAEYEAMPALQRKKKIDGA
jgi:uncharacterized protein YlxP (DUF503 family)